MDDNFARLKPVSNIEYSSSIQSILLCHHRNSTDVLELKTTFCTSVLSALSPSSNSFLMKNIIAKLDWLPLWCDSHLLVGYANLKIS